MWLRCTSRPERHEVNPGSQVGDLGDARARGAADSCARCRAVDTLEQESRTLSLHRAQDGRVRAEGSLWRPEAAV